MTVFASDLREPEAPVLLPAGGGWLCVEMAPDRGWVCRLDAQGGTKQVIARTGRPNGLAVDRTGAIWVAESKDPCILRLDMAGAITARIDRVDGEPMLFPNDIAIGPDGSLYVTDTGVRNDVIEPGGQLRPDWDELPIDGRIYRVDPQTLAIERFDGGMRFTNGIALAPDDSGLYATETFTGNVYRYRLGPDGRPGPREQFANVLDPAAPRVFGGPDGMKFGRDGNLYCAVFGRGEVCALHGSGAVVERLRTRGSKPTNLAFGPPGDRRIYVTEVERGVIEVLDVDTDGVALHG